MINYCNIFMLLVLLEPNINLLFESEVKYGRYKRKHRRLRTYIQDVSNSIKWGSRMINFLSISMLLVLLEPVNHADSKYVFGSQIRKIENTHNYAHISKMFLIP